MWKRGFQSLCLFIVTRATALVTQCPVDFVCFLYLCLFAAIYFSQALQRRSRVRTRASKLCTFFRPLGGSVLQLD